MNLFRILIVVAALVSLAACGDKDTEDSGHEHSDSGTES